MSKNFKHLTTPEDMVSLSPNARKKLDKWLQEKGYGMDMPDGEFFPTTQLSVSQMIEFLRGKIVTSKTAGIHYRIVWDDRNFWTVYGDGEDDSFGDEYKQLCDALFQAVKEILEEKN